MNCQVYWHIPKVQISLVCRQLGRPAGLPRHAPQSLHQKLWELAGFRLPSWDNGTSAKEVQRGEEGGLTTLAGSRSCCAAVLGCSSLSLSLFTVDVVLLFWRETPIFHIGFSRLISLSDVLFFSRAVFIRNNIGYPIESDALTFPEFISTDPNCVRYNLFFEASFLRGGSLSVISSHC